jgi:hypothetical protein
MNDWHKLDPLAELPPTCCGHHMDPNLGGWTCMKCGHHVRPYPDDPEPEPDPYAVSPDLSLELDEARARNDELEHKLVLAFAKELRIRSMLQECIRLIANEHLEGARVAERIMAELAGGDES